MADLAVFVGRLLIAVLFIGGVVQKGTDPSAVEGLLAGRGWPVWLVWPALAFNAAAAASLIIGIKVRPMAVALERIAANLSQIGCNPRQTEIGTVASCLLCGDQPVSLYSV